MYLWLCRHSTKLIGNEIHAQLYVVLVPYVED
jgi:hypothetical protein